MQSFIAIVSILFAFAALACMALLVVAYLRNETKERERRRQIKNDIADMTLLFQTMRDIIVQQKNMANDFNDEVERKMALVKQVLARGMEKNEVLYDKQQALAHELQDATETLESLQRQISILSNQAATQGIQLQVPHKRPNPAPIRKETPIPAKQKFEEEAPLRQKIPASQAREKARSVLTDDMISEWSELDINTPDFQSKHNVRPNTKSRPHTPEDAEAARDAFRALLDLENDFTSSDNYDGQMGESRDTLAAPHDDNGRATSASPVQRRVLEYSKAGMSVVEIARELGIAKGEVRLMLSLAGKKPGRES